MYGIKKITIWILTAEICMSGFAKNTVYAEEAAAEEAAAQETISQEASTQTDTESENLENCYGYQALRLMGDDAVLTAYLDLRELIGNYDGSVSSEELVFSEPLTEDQFTSAWMAFRGDTPQYFWYSPEFPQLTESDAGDRIYVSAAIAYSYSSRESLDAAKAEFDAAIGAFMEEAGIDMEEGEIAGETALYSKLGDYLTLQNMEDTQQATYRAIVEKRGSCLGVSNALAYLLQQYGIMAHVINGKVKEDNDVMLDHAWVLVRLEGKFYWCDLSWDMSGETAGAEYANKSDDIFRKEHYFPTDYPLVRCTDSLYG